MEARIRSHFSENRPRRSRPIPAALNQKRNVNQAASLAGSRRLRLQPRPAARTMPMPNITLLVGSGTAVTTLKLGAFVLTELLLATTEYPVSVITLDRLFTFEFAI